MISEKSFYKTFALLTLSLALQNLLTYGVNLADNLMLGSYSETALSGSALCNHRDRSALRRRYCCGHVSADSVLPRTDPGPSHQ